MKLQTLIDQKLAEFFFITPNKPLLFGDYKVPQNVDLPVTEQAVGAMAKDDNGFDFGDIVGNMCLVVGLDEDFLHRNQYISIVENMLKDAAQYCLVCGSREFNAKHWVEAIGFFKAAAFFADDAYDAHFRLGQTYYQMYHDKVDLTDCLTLARQAFMNAAEQGDTPEIDYFLSFINFHLQHFSSAYQSAKRALQGGLAGELKDDLVQNITFFEDRAKYQSGYRFVLQARYQEALEVLLSISEESADDWRVQFFIGLSYRGMGQVSSAIPHLKKACDLNPTTPATFNDLAVAYLMLNDFTAAKQVLSDGLHQHARDFDLLCNMAIAQIYSGDFDLAEAFLNQAERVSGDATVLNEVRQQLNERRA